MNNSIITTETKVEILAPAGTYETFRAVINAGADAVYLGGRLFGARAYAGNLSDEEIIQAIEYAHLHHRKVYLTVNTLFKNRELEVLYDYLLPFYEAGLDAVIVQDYGAMKLIHECFPDMEIHASTQMIITHELYMEFLKPYGVTRIVPARELSLSDITRIRAAIPETELECFVHGALCYCYSGQCLMSSFIGGRSGNRGRCAQPCRLPYEYEGKEYPYLSLKDLCTLEIIPSIIEAGVNSFKIEGRMKSPEYAAGITSLYRKYTDLYYDKGKEGYYTDHKDLEQILMLFDRGGHTKGYYVMHNGREMIANAEKSDKSQTERALLLEDLKNRFVDTTMKKRINCTVTLLKNNSATLALDDNEGHTVTVHHDTVMQAMNHPMSREDIIKQLSKMGNTFYEPAEFNINMDDDIFIPNKSLNELRRAGLNALTDVIQSEYRRHNAKDFDTDGNIKSVKSNKALMVSAEVISLNQGISAVRAGADRIYAGCEIMSYEELFELRKFCRNNNSECFLALPRIFLEDYSSFITKHTKEITQIDFDGFLIRNIAEYVFLKKAGINGSFIADYSIYAFNDVSGSLLLEYGFDGITAPVELNKKELAHLNVPCCELPVYGKIPLMVTANCITKTTKGCHKTETVFSHIKDRKNASLMYMSCCRFCYNVIYNSVPLYLLDRREEWDKMNFTGISFRFTDENCDIVEKYIKSAVSGSDSENLTPANYTRGHFTRGVE